MKPYLSVIRLRFIHGLQYRAAAIAGILTQLFFGLIFIMILVAFYEHSAAPMPISLQELAAYIWLQQIFLGFIALWFRDPSLFQMITSGNIAYELCRPCELYPFWYAKLIAERLASVILRCFPLIAVILFFPEPYRMTMPSSAGVFVLFLCTLLLGLFLIVSISMLIYISVFWTMSPTGSILLIAVAGEFLSGMIIPVPLMPEWLQSITYVLPFRWAADFPFRVYSGHIPASEAVLGMGVQLLWLGVLVGVGYRLLRRALRQVVVQGG
jgi:ABC-2 type transport system permease protein